MCGIAGALIQNNQKFTLTETYLNTMRDTMIHRGPDGAGTWISPDQKIGLAHRRLSIIDLSQAAHQPMTNGNQSIVISYNGEIYNHRELRQQLNKIRKINWQTDHSDTEVILRAYETWGIACLEKLRGMFAIAIWDAKHQQLHLIRDRLGIKPLYYSNHHNRITFASEIKALLTDPDQPKTINEDGLYHYLSFLTTPAPMTLFKGIQKLEAGTYLTITPNGQQQTTRYYDPLDHTTDLTGKTEKQITDQILTTLEESVQLRKLADVPVGVFLSGGIDSSTNAALFSHGENKPIKTFSIGYDENYGSYQNELHYAKQMADYVNAEYHEKRLTQQDLLDFLPKMIWLQDEPIADPVCVPVYYLSELAKQNGVTVCQVGEGADELYWGYPTWKLKHRLQTLANLPATHLLKKLTYQTMNLMGKQNTQAYEALRRTIAHQPIFWGGAEAFTETQKNQILSPRLQQKYKNRTSWEVIEPIYQRFHQKAQEKSTLNWMTYIDLNLRLPELLLMRIDKMSMGVSLEARVPFLDQTKQYPISGEINFKLTDPQKTISEIKKTLHQPSTRNRGNRRPKHNIPQLALQPKDLKHRTSSPPKHRNQKKQTTPK